MKLTVVAKVGNHGCVVSLVRRSDSPNLYLRWWDRSLRHGKGDYVWESLGHDDEAEGEARALEISAVLRRGNKPQKEGSLTLALLLALYEQHRTRKKKPRQQKADERRMDYFLEYFRGSRDVLQIDVDALDGYVERRRAQGIGDTTIGHEIVFLRGCMDWATTKRGASGKPLLPYNPLAGAKRIRTAEPVTPIADPRTFAIVYRYSDRVDAQRYLRCFLMLAHEHGWRLSAIRQLRGSDVDLASWRDPATGVIWPYGRIRRRSATDKAGKFGWLPLTPRSHRALRRHLRRCARIGEAYLFNAPVAAGPWQEQHALDLLHRTEEYASRRRGEELVLGGFHALRRLWATRRKGFPIVDVAKAGGWHPGTLLNHYMKDDPETTLEVTLKRRSK